MKNIHSGVVLAVLINYNLDVIYLKLKIYDVFIVVLQNKTFICQELFFFSCIFGFKDIIYLYMPAQTCRFF